MIVRDRLPLRRVWPRVSRRLGVLFLIDTTVALLYVKGGVTALALPSLPLAMMGAGLSVFLAFRNNSAYDRWWEARTLWGALVNESRTFARQAKCILHEPLSSVEGRETHDTMAEVAPATSSTSDNVEPAKLRITRRNRMCQ